MTQKTDNIVEVIKKGSVYVFGGLCVMLLTAWFTGSAAAQSFDGVIDTRIDNRVNEKINTDVVPILKSMQSDMSTLLEDSYNTYIATINGQVKKIRGNSNEVDIGTIEYILQKWKTFPDARKTDDLAMKYQCIKDWYARNQK